MDNYLLLEKIYHFIYQGVIFKFVDRQVKVLVKKSLEQSTKEAALDFVSHYNLALTELLVINNNILSENSPIIRTNNMKNKLSFAQERLWFIDRYEESTSAYNVPMYFELAAEIDIEQLEQSLCKVVERHEVLRTLIKEDDEGNGYEEVVSLADLPLTIRRIVVDSKEELEKKFQEDCSYLYALNREYPIRLAIYEKRPGCVCYLSVIVHHIAFDGWSIDVFLRDLQRYYRQESVEPLTIQYKDFALWQRIYLSGARLEEELSYWKDKLKDYEPLNLMTDKVRPSQINYHGESVKFKIDQEISQGLRELAKQCGVSLYSVLLSAYYLMLRAYSNQDNIIVGSLAANRHYSQTENIIGFFVNSLALCVQIDSDQNLIKFIKSVGEMVVEAQLHQDLPFEKLVEEMQIEKDTSRHPLFQVLFLVQNFGKEELDAKNKLFSAYEADYPDVAKFDLTMGFNDGEEVLKGWINYATSLYKRESIEQFITTYEEILKQFFNVTQNKNVKISHLRYLSKEDQDIVYSWNTAAKKDLLSYQSVVQLFEEQVSKTPDAIAVVFKESWLTYGELNAKANQLARYIRLQYQEKTGKEFGKDMLVAICIERSIEMLIGILAILKAGGAYVPFDAKYPDERIRYMLRDTDCKLMLTQNTFVSRLAKINSDVELLCLDVIPYMQEDKSNLSISIHREDLAYVIYTSGTTGEPKGVMIEQGNVVNFLVNMDLGEVGVWLAVTNISFDISVLELLGTLIKGFKVILTSEVGLNKENLLYADKKMDFGLFYFGNYASNLAQEMRYQILLEGAKYADENDFTAVWTPERHFAEFGGLYPNPAITSAALAGMTKRISIRSGSCVLPLHNPIRVAEDWALIDNLSQGRVGLAFASGWHENDFILMPENYKDRKNILLESLSMVQKLWRGEAVTVTGVKGEEREVNIYPRPIQGELPFWLTTAGSPEVFRKAGEIGAKVLTHLLGQSIDELAEKIKIYKNAYKAAGHDKGNGQVVLMIHAFVSSSEEYVLSQVKEPFKNYLRTAVDLIKKQERQGDLREIEESDMETVLEQAFVRYYKTSGLFGTPDSCLKLVDQLKGAGVDELACLIDFGVAEEIVLSNLQYLNELRLKSRALQRAETPEELIERHDVTHVQCTPSLAQLIFEEEHAVKLKSLKQIFLGGEALTESLVKKIRRVSNAKLCNLYGPTEATIWATLAEIDDERITIGKPLPNMEAYILNRDQVLCGKGMVGELYLSGLGIARGYLHRESLTAERFRLHQLGPSANDSRRLYKTGDLCRYQSDGRIEYVGRDDLQVKLRGYRIELAEIEHVLCLYPSVKQAAVFVKENVLIGYYLAESSLEEKLLVNYLSQFLPDYMVPQIFVYLENFPLSINGKLNQSAFPVATLVTEQYYIAPSNDVERHIRAVYSELLEIEEDKISVNDNFFRLGGNSILTIRLVRKLALRLNREIPIALLFQNLTIRGLSENLIKTSQEEVTGEEVEF